ncbi:MAG TPA: capsular biosynthesis protein, partial [Bacteroidetes bacterium]|nr:capsular biosynthesis protein [Bacteroidota bacterium]
KRKEIFDIYTDKLSNHDWAILPDYFNEIKTSSFHLYLLRISGFDENKRNMLIEKMSHKGIATNVHYKPLPLLSLYKNLGYKIEGYPMSFSYYRQEVTLPVYYDLTKEDALRVVDSLIEEVNRIND